MRRLIPTLSMALAVTLAAGCGTTSDEPAASTSSAAPSASKVEPAAAIKQGMERSLAGTLTMDASVKAGSQSVTMNGKVDSAARKLLVTAKAPEAIEARLIGDTAYIKSASLGGKKPWMKIDLTKLRPASSLRQSFDVKSQTGIIGGVVSAQEVGGGKYIGVADLEKAAAAASNEGGMRDGITSSAKLAKNPTAIPFEATLDADGRMTALSYTIATKTLGDLVSDMRMSDFGQPVTVEVPPAGETEAASKDMYTFL